MTTITINENIKGLPKNDFDSIEELFQVLTQLEQNYPKKGSRIGKNCNISFGLNVM